MFRIVSEPDGPLLSANVRVGTPTELAPGPGHMVYEQTDLPSGWVQMTPLHVIAGDVPDLVVADTGRAEDLGRRRLVAQRVRIQTV